METAGGKVDSPIENIGRSTRRSRRSKSVSLKLNETKDQENVNNTSLEQNNVEPTAQNEITKINTIDEKVLATSTNLNSSTPRRKKDPLANLHSNLSPKYIGFSTPTNQLNSSVEERTRSLRKRHNHSSSINEDSEENKKEIDITFTPNTESTVGFVRCTPRSKESPVTPDNNIKRKKFVSPIDKLLIKNGAVMEFNNNLPAINHDEICLNNEELLANDENQTEMHDKELGVEKLKACDKESDVHKSQQKDELQNFVEKSEHSETASTSSEKECNNSNENSENEETSSIPTDTEADDPQTEAEDNISISTEIAKRLDDDDEDSELEQDKTEDDLDDLATDKNIPANNYESSSDKQPTIDKELSAHGPDIDKEKEEEEEESKNLQVEDDSDCKSAPTAEESDVLLIVDENKVQESQNNKVEVLPTDKFDYNEKDEADETASTASHLPGKQTAQIQHKVIAASRCPIIKIELESIENEFIDAPSAFANSPSAISMDSAKGSSIVNDGTWMSFSTGDLYWGQIYNFCYWPCMVCPDPDGKTITTEETGRSGDQTFLVHVRFFADNGRRNWVKRDNLMPFTGIESYQERIVEIREKYGTKSPKYKLYVPTKKKEHVWFEAVKEADIVAGVAYADRLGKFYEIFEKSKASQKLEKQRRKSMYISVNPRAGSDIESLYGSNDNINNLSAAAAMRNKRERSISPYSPAYSPIKCVPAKRRKLSSDHGRAIASSSKGSLLALHSEENLNTTALSLSHANSVASLNSNSSSCNDLDLYSSLEFRKLYAYMKEYVMEQNQDENLEKSLVVAVRNIWALRQLNRRQAERKLRDSLTETDSTSSLVRDGSVKRLSSRLKTLMVRKSLMAQQNYDSTTPERSETPKALSKEAANVEKVKRPINRPILEVIDDIFDLDTKYLFKGLCREPVCKYCFKPGENLRKCAKNCTYWLHKDCLHKDFNQSKARRGAKPTSGPKVVNSNDSLNGSRSSSLVSLTEVGTASHVTGDSEAIDVPEVICKECANNEPPKCIVCNSTESKKEADALIKCSMTQCERSCHPACCKYWPQAKLTISKSVIESFRCPSHVCHTCVSDDPKGKFQHLSNAKLTKCIKCPATFHTDSTCIPAGSQILTAAHIICPRHLSTKLDMTVNVNWCFICVRGGQLMCCETCPTAVHAHCLKIPIAANEGYICEECESGRMPLYGEMVWAKFNNFRWWPAIILPPTEVPKNIARKPHNPSDFVVRFFGTHDHGWISRRRVYLYLEGDFSEPPKSKSSLDLNYNKGVEEAKEVYQIIKAKKLQQRSANEDKEKLHPQPYVRIKANRAVPPVKLHVDMESVSKCECDAREENPCGPDTNCLNRVLYHECNPKICPAGERCQNQMFESRVSPRLEVVYMKEKGFGLVCREAIKAGSFIIEYVGEIINDDEFQARMQQKSRDRDENFYFLSVEKDYIIDAGPKGNLARFMNHSCDPNCETQKWSVNSLNRVGLFAIQDIPENTELTFNYHWDDLLGNEKKTCYCGAKNCAGQIGAKIIKDLETVKMPTAAIGTAKNKLKIKSKSKPNPKKKLLHNNNGRGLKTKLVTKLKLKAKAKTKTTKKKMAAKPAESAVAEAKSAATTTNTNTSKTSTKTESEADDAPSTSRNLKSPDIFE